MARIIKGDRKGLVIKITGKVRITGVSYYTYQINGSTRNAVVPVKEVEII